MTQARKLSPHEPQYGVVLAWYIDEAALLDNQLFNAWYKLLSPQIDYRMPVRETVMRQDGAGVSDRFFHFEEDAASLHTRVRRLTEGKSAWAEDPPSRTRRFVSNLRASVTSVGEIQATTNLFVTRSRNAETSFELISCERSDVLVPIDGGLRLRQRLIVPDQAILGVVNLAIFL